MSPESQGQTAVTADSVHSYCCLSSLVFHTDYMLQRDRIDVEMTGFIGDVSLPLSRS